MLFMPKLICTTQLKPKKSVFLFLFAHLFVTLTQISKTCVGFSMKSRNIFNFLLAAAAFITLWSCANIGSPEGGPRDYTPPVLLQAKPAPGALNVSTNKVELRFDEYIQLKDQLKKVVVSPVQKEMPQIRTTGKKITVEFRDSMKPNTTYVIDFSNAIQDNNEGNAIDGFSYAFSTGDEIDTLQISGIVLRAKDLEPMQHVLVGLHSNLDDSAFTTLPFDRISRTNDRGEFTIRNLKPGRYHVFALSDLDGDYKMARTEDIAFNDSVFVPYTRQFASSDTIFTFDHRVDSVYNATHTEYLPNDVLLTMFNEGYTPLYLFKTQRLDDSKLWVKLSTKTDSLPEIKVISPEPKLSQWFKAETRPGNDSIIYWLTDSTLIKADSIKVALTYMHTDSTDQITPQTDTIAFAVRKTNAQLKEEAQKLKDNERHQKELSQAQERIAKAIEQGKEPNIEDSILVASEPKRILDLLPKVNVDFTKSSLAIGDSIAFTTSIPLSSISPTGVTIEQEKDSLWIPLHDAPIPALADDYTLLRYTVPMALTPGEKYRITIDSLALTSIHDTHNHQKLQQEFKVRGTEEFANLFLRVSGIKGKAIVQLLDGSDKVVAQSPLENGEAKFLNVEPSIYYARLFLDLNDNGKWDTGNYSRHLQPEFVFYYHKKLRLKKNWDIDETWNIAEMPLNQQKPDDIKQNRPERKKNAIEPQEKKKNTDEEEEDEFNSSGFSSGVYSGNKYSDYRNK